MHSFLWKGEKEDLHFPLVFVFKPLSLFFFFPYSDTSLHLTTKCLWKWGSHCPFLWQQRLFCLPPKTTTSFSFSFFEAGVKQNSWRTEEVGAHPCRGAAPVCRQREGLVAHLWHLRWGGWRQRTIFFPLGEVGRKEVVKTGGLCLLW